jgi:hypothetical protein
MIKKGLLRTTSALITPAANPALPVKQTTLSPCLSHSLKMESALFSQTTAPCYKTAMYYIPENCDLAAHCCENLNFTTSENGIHKIKNIFPKSFGQDTL